jgi:zinc protease
VLREPAFPADEFDVARRERRERLDKSLTEPMALAPIAMQRKLNPYPPSDVRYVPTLGEEIAQLDAVKLDDVKELYRQQLGGSVGELAVVGDFDPDATAKQVDGFLRGWKSATAYKRVDRTAPAGVEGGKTVLNTPDKATAFYIAGSVFPLRDDDPEYPALEVGNYLLGGGPLTSRLANLVRQKKGLSYTVASQFGASPIDRAGRFMMYAICNPENMPKLDAAMTEELARYLKEGPSLSELEEGKRAYLEQEKVNRARDAALAGEIANNLFIGRTFAFTAAQEKKIAELNPDQVREAFRKFIDPKKLVTVEAGDFKK